MNILIQKFWAIFLPFFLTILIFYIIIIVVVFLLQNKFLYFPEKKYFATPDDFGFPYEEITFISQDKLKLCGWFIPAKNPKSILLFLHGNAGNISHRLESIRIFNQLGFNVFIFDYRGYGKSEGKPTEKGTYLDAQAAWDFLTNQKKYKPSQIIIFGRSLGGSIATYLASQNQPRLLIIESAFTSIDDLAKQIYPFLPIKFIKRLNYNTKKYIQQVNCPVLIIHSQDDEIIPFENGKKLFTLANEPKQFLEISGDHNNGFILSLTQYMQGLNKFFEHYY